MTDEAPPKKPPFNQNRKSRGDIAREALANVTLLPPDPKQDPRLVEVSTDGRLPGHINAAPPTQGILEWREGMNPRARKRRVREALHSAIQDMAPEAGRALRMLVQDTTDTRVQLAAIQLVVQYNLGKPGEMDAGDDASESRGSVNMALATAEERAELNAALATVHRISAILKERAASDR